MVYKIRRAAGQKPPGYGWYALRASEAVKPYLEAGFRVPAAVTGPPDAGFELNFGEHQLVVEYLASALSPVFNRKPGANPRDDFEETEEKISLERSGCSHFTTLSYSDTSQGLLVHNIQSYSKKPPDDGRFQNMRFINELFDSGLEVRVGLDAMKTLVPERQLHVLAPHEVRANWGVKSPYFLSNGGFWKHVRSRHPDDVEKLVARALFEHPTQDFLGDICLAEKDHGLSPDQVTEIAFNVKREGFAPGGRLLKRVIQEYAGLEPASHLGRRRAKRYYRDIPIEQGFTENTRSSAFEGGFFPGVRPLHVLTYDPLDGRGHPKTPPLQELMVKVL